LKHKNEEIFVINCRGERLSGVLHLPEAGKQPGRLVILCHGMLSSKNGTKQVALAGAFQETGLACLRFDFSGCGDSAGRIEQTTLTRRLDDLAAVAAFAAARGFSGIAAVGSSLGAAVCLLAAGRVGPSSLVLLAPVSRPSKIVEKFPEPDVRRWREDGFFEMEGVRIDWGFVMDAQRHDILAASKKITCPTLLIHGSKDELVPVESSKEIFASLDCEKELVILEGADHSFTGLEHVERIVRLALRWIGRDRSRGEGAQPR
jgi:pimeloyl-ACP methyl ester carboxylesterase